ncbi:Uncharacterized protein TCAP_00510, partial [Tolypocladium capitatum]
QIATTTAPHAASTHLNLSPFSCRHSPNDPPTIQTCALRTPVLAFGGLCRPGDASIGLPTFRDELPLPSFAFVMRVRWAFAGVFLLQLLAAGYAGLSSLRLGQYVNDKVLHLLTFFSLTVNFYWIFDTNRRRIINMTLIVVTIVLGGGSEFVQDAVPNGRSFDVYDIVANLVGSFAGLGLCLWYHKRMSERRRQKRGYGALPGEDDVDIELGQDQQTGVTAGPSRERTEADDWAEDDPSEASAPATAQGREPETPNAAEPKKRTD